METKNQKESKNTAKLKKCTLYIKGMHCPSCEILITDKFKELSYVTAVKFSFQKQEAEIYFTGDLDKEKVNYYTIANNL